jgi:hypothetical protein
LEKLELFERLPPVEDLDNLWISNRTEFLRQCMGMQHYPYQRWRNRSRPTENIEHYLAHQWVPIPWSDANNPEIPFGYVKDVERARKLGVDPGSVLFPVADELFLLEEARILLKKYSLDSVAAWLTKKINRKVYPNGLKRRLESENRRQNRARTYKNWARKLAGAIVTASKIEEEHPGSKVPWCRHQNYHGKSNSGTRGRFSERKAAKNPAELLKLADPRPYLKAVEDEFAEKTDREPREKPYPACIEHVCGDGP